MRYVARTASAFSLLVALFLVCPTEARAAWHEASGANFVVYANQSQRGVKRFAEKLERYHAALCVAFGVKSVPPSPSNRVSVYVVSNKSQVKRLYGEDASRYLTAFYRGRAGGSIAVVPRVKSKSKGRVSASEHSLLHEYAHHFMFSNTDRLMPRWYSEGFAEFYAAAKFDKDGSVGLGLPSDLRAWELQNARPVSIEEIFDTRKYLAKKTKLYDDFYGRSWLLYHYLVFSDERRDQLSDYLARLQTGVGELQAAQSSFGSLANLDAELKKYHKRKTLDYVLFSAAGLKVAPVTVRTLSAGESAILPTALVSKLGVNLEKAKELLPDARRVAENYPANAVVLGALAEAEVDARNYGLAIEAADAALALDASSIQAHIQKGLAMRSLAQEQTEGASAAEKAAAWSKVRQQIMKANRLEPENPLPLVHFYNTYGYQGIEPTENSVRGLESSLSNAPFDGSVRWLMAKRLMAEGRYAEARATIIPLAYGPHQEADSAAVKLLKEAERKLAKQTNVAEAVN